LQQARRRRKGSTDFRRPPGLRPQQPLAASHASVTVIHAVVLRAPTLSEERARAAAEAILSAVATARDEDDFEARAQTAVKNGARVTVERLPAFDVSGPFDPVFIAAALALRVPGETSGIVETPFGWHVLRLVSRMVPLGPELDAARSRAQDVAVSMRVRLRVREVLQERRASTRINASSDAERLMALASER
jgi:hypothetical protein